MDTQSSPLSGVHVGSAQGVVPGCPNNYNLLESSAFARANRFLYGSPAVRLDATDTGGAPPSRATKWISPYLLAWWYSAFQRHVPYSHEGLGAHEIMCEAAVRVPHNACGETDESERRFKRRVWAMLTDMHADQKWYSLRFGNWLLTHIFRWLYNGEIYVCPDAIRRLRATAGHSTFVLLTPWYMWLVGEGTFRQLAGIIHSACRAQRHAGDNLRLPIVGSIMRTCGAFFIRRSVKGCADASLYKTVLAAYLHTLLFHGISTEFFIEGGRSRDGRIAAPKLGLLSTCVDASLSGRCNDRPVHVVPVTITYDVPLEERGMLRELMGEPKQKETVLQFASAFGKMLSALVWNTCVQPWRRRLLGLGGRNGRAAIGFGEPVAINTFLRERARRRRRHGGRKSALQLSFSASDLSASYDDLAELGTSQPLSRSSGRTLTPAGSASTEALAHAFPDGSDTRRAAVAALGRQIHSRMLRVNVVPSSALLAAVLLPAPIFAAIVQTDHPQPDRRENKRKRDAVSKRNLDSHASGAAALSTVCERYQWLQRTLSIRGFNGMPLPLTVPLDTNGQALMELVKACAPHVTVQHTGQEARFALTDSAEAAVWQHARLNYLLPALAAPACIACAIHMHASGTEAYVQGAQISDSALWLRRLLAPDLDDALGTDALTCKMHVLSELAQLVTDGVLVQRTHGADSVSPTENVDDGIVAVRGSTAAAPQDEFAIAPSGRAVVAMSIAALAPMVCTYAAVLQHALTHAETLPQSSTALTCAVLTAVRAHCEGQGGALGPVPSKLLVQHGILAWTQQGYLVCDAGASGVLEHVHSSESFAGSSADASPSKSSMQAAERSQEPQRAAQSFAQGGIASSVDESVRLATSVADDGKAVLDRLLSSLRALQPLQPGWLR